MATAPVDFEVDGSNLPPGQSNFGALPKAGRLPPGFEVEEVQQQAPPPGGARPTDLDARLLGDAGLGAIHGLSKVGRGVLRLGLKAMQAAGQISDEHMADFDSRAQEADKTYQDHINKNFGPNNFASKAGEFGGEMIGTAPAMLLKAPAAMGAVGRAMNMRVPRNAIQGAAVGAVLARPDHIAQDTLVGAAGGAAIPEILRSALLGVGKISSWVASRAPSTGAQAQRDIAFGDLSPIAQDELKSAGLDWSKLADETKQNVLSWVRQNSGKTPLTPAEATRLGIFTSVGARPTKAMVTQSFDDFSRENMLEHQAGGDPIRDAYAGVSRAFGQKLEDQSLAMGGNTGDRSVAGLNVIDSLRSGRDESRQAVTAAYDAARTNPDIGNKVSFAPIRRYLKADEPAIISSQSTVNLRNGAEAWLRDQNAIGPGAKPMTIEKAESFKQWLNERWDPKDAGVLRMIRNLQNEVDNSVMSSGKGDVFETARTAHKLRKETYDNKELIRSLLDQENPIDRKIAVEDAWDRIVLRSDVAQLWDLKNTLQKGARITMGPNESATVAQGNQAWKDTQTSTMEWLIEKAKSKEKGPNDSVIYLHGKLKDALSRVGKEKLDILFGADGVKQLDQVVEAMRLAKPIKGTTNPSGSGHMIARFFSTYLPRLFGSAAGAAATGGNPIGAAAGGAAGDAMGNTVGAFRTGQKAGLMTRPLKAIAKDRAPKIDLEQFAPGGAPSVTGLTYLRDLANEK